MTNFTLNIVVDFLNEYKNYIFGDTLQLEAIHNFNFKNEWFSSVISLIECAHLLFNGMLVCLMVHQMVQLSHTFQNPVHDGTSGCTIENVA